MILRANASRLSDSTRRPPIQRPPIWGQGLSCSSHRALLEEGLRLVQQDGRLDVDAVIAAALKREKDVARFPVAGQDVVSIACGGVTQIRFDPQGSFFARHLDVEPEWINRHVLLAITHGKPHSVPTLLSELLTHPAAAGFIETISVLGTQAASALEDRRLRDLAGAVNEYRETFSRWHPRFVSNEVAGMIARLQSDCGDTIICVCAAIEPREWSASAGCQAR